MTFLTHHLNLISNRLTLEPTNLISYPHNLAHFKELSYPNSMSQLCLRAPWAKRAAKMIFRDQGTQWLNMFSSLKLGLPLPPPLLIWQVEVTDGNRGKSHLGVDSGDKHKPDWTLFGCNVPRSPKCWSMTSLTARQSATLLEELSLEYARKAPNKQC